MPYKNENFRQLIFVEYVWRDSTSCEILFQTRPTYSPTVTSFYVVIVANTSQFYQQSHNRKIDAIVHPSIENSRSNELASIRYSTRGKKNHLLRKLCSLEEEVGCGVVVVARNNDRAPASKRERERGFKNLRRRGSSVGSMPESSLSHTLTGAFSLALSLAQMWNPNTQRTSIDSIGQPSKKHALW